MVMTKMRITQTAQMRAATIQKREGRSFGAFGAAGAPVLAAGFVFMLQFRNYRAH